MKGIFLALEGIDGCGKSTQLEYLSKWLLESGLMPKGKKLYKTREPGGTILGSHIRKLLLKDYINNSPMPLTELLLYAADRAQHVDEIIIPMINNGHWVISDRFSGSTMAYQGFGRNIDKNIIKSLENIATKGIKPDLTIFLDISVADSIKRRISKEEDRIEAEGELFLEKVSNGFAVLAKKEDWLIINAGETKEKVAKEIQNQLSKSLAGFIK